MVTVNLFDTFRLKKSDSALPPGTQEKQLREQENSTQNESTNTTQTNSITPRTHQLQ